jgi:hypothetical protein
MSMLYELRTYHAMPGRLPDLNRRFADITMGHMLAYDSLADREKKWGAFFADQDRLARFAETEKNGPLLRRLTAQILRPTAYSPMQ